MLTVLQNSLVIGISGASDITALSQTSANSPGQVLNMSGLFFILDTTGKDAEFNQLWPALVSALPKEVTHTHYDFGGTSIEKFAGPNSTTFTARAGNRFVWSNQQKVMEDLVGRMKSAAPSANSLAENADLQRCQAHALSGSVVDFFYRFPDFSKLPFPATPQMDTGAMTKAMHFDAMHAACGTFSMTPDGALSRVLLLADTSQDSPVSWFGSNHTQFDSLALVPPSASTVTVGSFDLQAFYKTIKVAVVAAMPGRQQASADLMEGMVSAQLGMPLTDALGVFRGEFASIKLTSQSADPPQLFALTISNPQRIMDLIHKLAPTQISDETQENGVTYFKTAVQIPTGTTTQPNALAKVNYIALTPRFLLFTSDRQVLRDFVARAVSPQGAAGGASIADNPDVRRLRAMMPADVMGFSVTDYAHTDFQKEMMKSFTDAESQANISQEELQLLKGLSQLPWTSFMGGIHWGVSAWWKAADGFHYEAHAQ
jgi:hypothetical protein